eukprot:270975-Pyramimonas_sp.AAC.1
MIGSNQYPRGSAALGANAFICRVRSGSPGFPRAPDRCQLGEASQRTRGVHETVEPVALVSDEDKRGRKPRT